MPRRGGIVAAAGEVRAQPDHRVDEARVDRGRLEVRDVYRCQQSLQDLLPRRRSPAMVGHGPFVPVPIEVHIRVAVDVQDREGRLASFVGLLPVLEGIAMAVHDENRRACTRL
uniref:Uncharacterized protein n=1 Tax=Alexandrium monilatum TaxID=311494 RepID=A0A7S4RGM7_9DINO